MNELHAFFTYATAARATGAGAKKEAKKLKTFLAVLFDWDDLGGQPNLSSDARYYNRSTCRNLSGPLIFLFFDQLIPYGAKDRI